MSEQNPIRLFVTHVWEDNEDYSRVFEYLESARNFFYKNLSTPDKPPTGDRDKQREDLRKQIANAEVIVALSSLAAKHQELLTFQMICGKSTNRPVVLLKHFGTQQALPKSLTELADEVVDWDERALVDAIRREARHEETTRWDTIEFKLD